MGVIFSNRGLSSMYKVEFVEQQDRDDFMHKIIFAMAAFIVAIITQSAYAADEKLPSCAASDKLCLMKQIELLTPSIERQDWQDITYRELAKSYAHEGKPESAIALIEKIKNSDTKAMTIRGIGMEIAGLGWDRARYNKIFIALAEQAKAISHGPSQGIAYTYIAMAQAFAGDDDGSRLTASAMTNAALRNKAYAETAEIQAERGDLKNTLQSISAIEASSFRNKAYDTVSKIFLDRGHVDEAYVCAQKIDNAYLKAKSIQRILNHGNPEEDNATIDSAETEELSQ